MVRSCSHGEPACDAGGAKTRARVVLLAALFALPLSAQAPATEPTTVIVVRHAERASSEDDSPLSAEGQRRAQTLAQMLRDTPLRAIITSQYVRTAQTAAPIAQQKQITPDVLPADKLDQLINRIHSLAGGTILVVHHSNTVPAIVAKLGGRTPLIADTEFDRLLIVTMTAGGSSVTTLRYGAAAGQ